MRRACLFLLLCACFSPDDILLLRGEVQGEGLTVELHRGTPDETHQACDELKLLKTVQSEAGGAFLFEVFRAQAMRLDTFEPFCFEVRTTYPSDTSAWARVNELYGERRLPLMPDWKPELREEAGVYILNPVAAREDDDKDFLVRHAVELYTPEGRLAWRQSDPEPLSADPRIIEEFEGTLWARGSYARAKEEVEFFGETRLDWSPIVQVKARIRDVAATQFPPSRGVTCTEFDGGCPWTDGVLEPVANWQPENPTDVLRVLMNFEVPFTPALLVARGIVSGSSIAVVYGGLSDGLLRPLGQVELTRDLDEVTRLLPDGGYSVPPAFAAIPLEVDEPIDTIELRFGPGFIDEVSVW